MSKVLILEGSPRGRGNSHILCDELMRGAEAAGNTVKRIAVVRKHVAGCLGCNACYKNDGACVHDDDMAQIREAMIAADVIVLASPIYFYSMSAQLKAVIDRTYAFYRQLVGKRFVFIVSCAADEASYTQTMLASLRGFTCCVPESQELGYVLGIGAMDAGDVRGTAAMQEAYELGAAIA